MRLILWPRWDVRGFASCIKNEKKNIQQKASSLLKHAGKVKLKGPEKKKRVDSYTTKENCK